MKNKLKKILSLGLCIMLVSAMPMMAAEESTYTAYPQGTLENIAEGKPVMVSNSTYYLGGNKNDSEDYIRSGKYLTDGLNGTWWESEKRNGEYVAGEWAMIDLGIPYDIYKLELIGLAENEEGRKNYKIYGTNTFDYKHDTLESVPNHYKLLMERGDEPFTATNGKGGANVPYGGIDSVTLNGESYRYIILKKTAAEAAKFSELRVYGVESKLIDVTPINVSKVTTNGNAPFDGLGLPQLIDGNHGTFAFIGKPSSGRLEINFDLGEEYYVKRVELWARNEGASGKDGAWKGRKGISLYATNDLSLDGTSIGSLDDEVSRIMLPGETSNRNTPKGDYAAGGTTLIYDNEASEATRYVKLKWGAEDYLSLAEVRIYAEDKTAETITVENVAEDIAPMRTSETYRIDLGGYYNVKKIDVIPKDGASIGNYTVVGNTMSNMREEAILAGEPGSISTAKTYDTKVQNMSRYITLKGISAPDVKEIKVWAEKGKVYANFALNKTNTALGGGGLTGGAGNGFAYGNLTGGLRSNDKFTIDLGAAKKIEGYMVLARTGWGTDANERSGYQVWGANSADFSDAVLLDKKDARPFVADGGTTRFVYDNGKYRYIAVTGLSGAEYFHVNGAPYDGENRQDFENKSQKVWNELMIFTEVPDAANVLYDPDNGFIDGDTALFGDFDSAEFDLGRYYPVSLVTVTPESATTADISVMGKNSETEEYTTIGTIPAGSTETELDGTPYRYIKLMTFSTQSISEITVCTPKKYLNSDIVTEECIFNDSKDGTGTEISDTTSAVLGAKVTVRNISTEAKNAVVITGLYDENNILKAVAVSDSKSIGANSTEVFATGIDNPGDLGENSSFKLFVWESLETINPYSPSNSIN